MHMYGTHTKCLAAVGFEPTPPRRLVPKTSALDHSATLPTRNCSDHFPAVCVIFIQVKGKDKTESK